MCAWFYSEEKDIVCIKRKINDNTKKTFWQQRWTNVSFPSIYKHEEPRRYQILNDCFEFFLNWQMLINIVKPESIVSGECVRECVCVYTWRMECVLSCKLRLRRAQNTCCRLNWPFNSLYCRYLFLLISEVNMVCFLQRTLCRLFITLCLCVFDQTWGCWVAFNAWFYL